MTSLDTQLPDIFRRVKHCWINVKTVWNDQVHWRFEKENWDPLEGQVQATQREIERLAQVIAQARRSVK
jgi:hypothetical protein